jgi:hypothetical protein
MSCWHGVGSMDSLMATQATWEIVASSSPNANHYWQPTLHMYIEKTDLLELNVPADKINQLINHALGHQCLINLE